MSVLAAVGDVLLVSVRATAFGQRVINTFHYGIAGMTGAPTLQAVADALDTKLNEVNGFMAKMKACCPPQWGTDFIWVQRVAPVRAVAFKYQHLILGSFASSATSANQASVIERRGDLANRKNVGCIHLVYPNLDQDASSGFVSTDLAAALVAFAPFLVNTVSLPGVATLQPVLFNGPTFADVTPITQSFVQTTIRTMSRRTVGRGE